MSDLDTPDPHTPDFDTPDPHTPDPDCPKSMVFGPCGGVTSAGGCEVGDRRCPFVSRPIPHFRADPAPAVPAPRSASGLRERLGAGRVVVADFPSSALRTDAIRAVAGVLHGCVDAVILGDSPRNRLQLPPAYRAAVVAAAGLTPWVGLNCRDRNRVALEAEVAALADLGSAAVHCVTGDHTDTGHRPDAKPVFDLDSTRLVALARSYGLLSSVAESPSSPPVGRRPGRLVEKVRAGAEVVVVNHCGGAEAVRQFLSRTADLGPAPMAIACVPLVIDHESAALLASFPSLVLPTGLLTRVLGASDPFQAGIAAAIELAEELMTVPGVVGVDLSGGATPGTERRYAEAVATVARSLGHPAAPD